MRKLKIAKQSSSERDKEFEKLIAVAKTKQLSNSEEAGLLDKIRRGNYEPIERLIDSWEVLILSVAKQIPTEIPIEELIDVGKNELTQLAEQEVNSPTDERFLRFGAWCVRQGMLGKVYEK
jgi:DNA-directed RNA polymerase specialized sigma subunit